MDPVLVFALLAIALVAAWLAALAWRLRRGAREPMPAETQALQEARASVRRLRDEAKAEPRRQLEAAKALGGKPR